MTKAEAIKILKYYAYDYALRHELSDFPESTVQAIATLKAETKTGQWIKHTDASGNSWHTCPACGHIAHTLTRFCPDCGACLEAPS